MLDHTEILTSVSLFYLTKSFASSTFIYAQNPNGFRAEYTKAKTDAPLLFSAFKYNDGFWPPAKVAQVGNLVKYQSMFELCFGIVRLEDGLLYELNTNLSRQITISAATSPGWITLLHFSTT